MNERKAFTLIELLVVIAIIGILATMAVVSFGSARVKARDAKRASDIKQVYNAVEMYNDEYGHYPNTNGVWTSFDSPRYKVNPIINPNAANLTEALQSWLSGAADPKRTSSNDSGYLFYSNGTEYCILFYLTPENLNNYPESLWNPKRCGGVGADGKCNVAGWQWGPLQSIFMGSPAYVNGC
jgi:prepilin-type N-terminal cleavage/methylation domain-containing protein